METLDEEFHTIAELWKYNIKRYSNNPFVGTPEVDKNGKVKYTWQTYGEVYSRMKNISRSLYSLFGLTPGDRFFLIENSNTIFFLGLEFMVLIVRKLSFPPSPFRCVVWFQYRYMMQFVIF
jgi:acyl-CoA synthetase (AMP-forming)/AMP-acid ligase II